MNIQYLSEHLGTTLHLCKLLFVELLFSKTRIGHLLAVLSLANIDLQMRSTDEDYPYPLLAEYSHQHSPIACRTAVGLLGKTTHIHHKNTSEAKKKLRSYLEKDINTSKFI
jgi:hypothetical protein